MGITGLILLMLLPSPVGAQDRYGTAVTSIEIEGAAPEELGIIPIAPGETLPPEAVRRSIQALYDSGTFGRIEVEAMDGPGGWSWSDEVFVTNAVLESLGESLVLRQRLAATTGEKVEIDEGLVSLL